MPEVEIEKLTPLALVVIALLAYLRRFWVAGWQYDQLKADYEMRLNEAEARNQELLKERNEMRDKAFELAGLADTVGDQAVKVVRKVRP